MKLEVSSEKHLMYVDEIQREMEDSAQKRGTGIAKRSYDYLCEKITNGMAIIALDDDGTWAGFCYIETWSEALFVANSGLIISPPYRNFGLATEVKKRIFQLSREKYPQAKIFGLTTGLAVMKINSELGYKPVIYSEVTQDDKFWNGCKSCVNYDILTSKNRKNCLCTAMLYSPNSQGNIIMNTKNSNDEEKCSVSI